MTRRTPLDGLLRYRCARERKRELILHAARREATRLSDDLSALETMKAGWQKEQATLIRAGVSARDLRVFSTAAFDSMIEAKKTEHELAQQRCEEERETYVSCRRDREAVEKAVERVRAEMEKERERKAQLVQDDQTLQRVWQGGGKSLRRSSASTADP